MLKELEDPKSKLTGEFDEEYIRAVVRAIYERIKSDFEEKTQKAFWLTLIEGRPNQAVAKELGMTADAVSSAKRRILKRLKEEGRYFLD